MTIGAMTSRTLVLVAGSLLLLAPVVSAELSNTQWQESTQVSRDEQSDVDAGEPSVPVSTSSSLTGVLASVFYPTTPSPPSVTSTVSGSASADEVNAWAFAAVTFQFQLNETTTPPVSITSVPMAATAKGTADASGTSEFSATARAGLTLVGESVGALVTLEACAKSPGPSASAAFNETVSFSIDPAEVVTGNLLASAQISMFSPASGNAGAEAFIDPIIVVSSDIIPGTSTRYDEVYEVEFSPGYWALGNPTPVEASTWGRIKQLYTH